MKSSIACNCHNKDYIVAVRQLRQNTRNTKCNRLLSCNVNGSRNVLSRLHLIFRDCQFYMLPFQTSSHKKNIQVQVLLIMDNLISYSII